MKPPIVRRCIECFNLRSLIPGKVICGDCLERLFPEKLAAIIIPDTPVEDEITQEKRSLLENTQALILLENAPEGLALEDFPERLRPAALYLHLRNKIRKPRNQDRYFHPRFCISREARMKERCNVLSA